MVKYSHAQKRALQGMNLQLVPCREGIEAHLDDPRAALDRPGNTVVHLDIGEGGVDGAPDGLQEGFHYPLHIHLPDDSQAFAVAFFRDSAVSL